MTYAVTSQFSTLSHGYQKNSKFNIGAKSPFPPQEQIRNSSFDFRFRFIPSTIPKYYSPITSTTILLTVEFLSSTYVKLSCVQSINPCKSKYSRRNGIQNNSVSVQCLMVNPGKCSNILTPLVQNVTNDPELLIPCGCAPIR